MPTDPVKNYAKYQVRPGEFHQSNQKPKSPGVINSWIHGSPSLTPKEEQLMRESQGPPATGKAEMAGIFDDPILGLAFMANPASIFAKKAGNKGLRLLQNLVDAVNPLGGLKGRAVPGIDAAPIDEQLLALSLKKKALQQKSDDILGQLRSLSKDKNKIDADDYEKIKLLGKKVDDVASGKIPSDKVDFTEDANMVNELNKKIFGDQQFRIHELGSNTGGSFARKGETFLPVNKTHVADAPHDNQNLIDMLHTQQRKDQIIQEMTERAGIHDQVNQMFTKPGSGISRSVEPPEFNPLEPPLDRTKDWIGNYDAWKSPAGYAGFPNTFRSEATGGGLNSTLEEMLYTFIDANVNYRRNLLKGVSKNAKGGMVSPWSHPDGRVITPRKYG